MKEKENNKKKHVHFVRFNDYHCSDVWKIAEDWINEHIEDDDFELINISETIDKPCQNIRHSVTVWYKTSKTE